MRILVIDDEPVVAGIFANALTQEGNQVLVATSGKEGLQVLEQSRPDAVFLDVAMPDLDGIEVLRRIRDKHAQLPVIILSGWATDRQLEAARRLGVTDVVLKPIALKNLSEALARIRRLDRWKGWPCLVLLSSPEMLRNIARFLLMQVPCPARGSVDRLEHVEIIGLSLDPPF